MVVPPTMADKPPPVQLQPSTRFEPREEETAEGISFPLPSSTLSSLELCSSTPNAAFMVPSNGQPRSSMALSAAIVETKKLDINSLMSPPDALLESFAHGGLVASGTTGKVDGANCQPTSRQPLPMSPPVSPCSKPVSNASSPSMRPSSSEAIKDPVLYPADDNLPASLSHPPLFAPAELENRRIVEDHVRARCRSVFAGFAPPRREDYELALTFRSQVMKHYTMDRRGWLRKERAFLEADRRAAARRYHSIVPARPTAAKPARPPRSDRVGKPGSAPRSNRNKAAAPAFARQSKPTGRVSATPEPARRMVAPNREDKDFGALPNFCPPLDSLPTRANSLKVDWKGQPIDLSHDPHMYLLHPDEVTLAGNLRLDCATYLTSKRRIFERRLHCLRTGKEFRKTDAQQACKIDVNKASKLWTAFEKVGWLDAGWVRPYL